MELQAEIKVGLHKMIDQIEDSNILQAVYVILEREKQRQGIEGDFYDDLQPSLQKSIEKGLAEIRSGQTIPHEEVRKRYEKWLK
jgi:predicted transcriptional regulator